MSAHTLSGTCRALYVFDVGRSIDLRRAESSLSELRKTAFQHKSRVPLGETTPPSRLGWQTTAVQLGRHATESTVEVALYEQGAACITWSIPIEAPLEELAELSAQLYDHDELIRQSRAVAEAVIHAIEGAVERPGSSGMVEDYVVFQVQPVRDAPDFLDQRRAELAQLLRAEQHLLARQEVDDATANPVSYEVDELCLVDWLAAFLMGADTDDERMLLEYATVELVLLRMLDERLDEGIEQAYDLLSKPRGMLRALTGQARELEQIARMQADDALLHEGIDNALKLFGDDYLARLYRTAAVRFHFASWDRSIQRKLGVLQSIYQSLADVSAHRRAEGLEWIIIVLIAVEIFLYLA
ncbi:MAG: hypothetical protein KDC14_06980 [Planctomycetes bacterium]|nr:hypothetical protein [Planctomycetota bacterium]